MTKKHSSPSAGDPVLLKGAPVAEKVFLELKEELASVTGQRPGLAVILVGDDPASKAYVGRKKKACAEIGIQSFEYGLPKSAGNEALEQLIRTLNEEEAIHGILLQLPLPEGYDEDRLLNLIRPEKDVDGFHPVNVGKMVLGLPALRSCTPYGVCELLRAYDIDPAGKHVVIVGRSNIVGKPLGMMLVQKGEVGNATVTLCHSRTQNLAEVTRQADILVAAIGRPEFITEDMVKEGAVVIDVGINRVDDVSNPRGYKLVGDVAYEKVAPKASAITPVPGGVGPMTIAMLMKNTVQAWRG